MQKLNLAIPKNSIAIDTALFQSASSYVLPYNRRCDPDAGACFTHVVTAFCNGSTLFCPLPKGGLEGFRRCWNSGASTEAPRCWNILN